MIYVRHFELKTDSFAYLNEFKELLSTTDALLQKAGGVKPALSPERIPRQYCGFCDGDVSMAPSYVGANWIAGYESTATVFDEGERYEFFVISNNLETAMKVLHSIYKELSTKRLVDRGVILSKEQQRIFIVSNSEWEHFRKEPFVRKIFEEIKEKEKK